MQPAVWAGRSVLRGSLSGDRWSVVTIAFPPTEAPPIKKQLPVLLRVFKLEGTLLPWPYFLVKRLLTYSDSCDVWIPFQSWTHENFDRPDWPSAKSPHFPHSTSGPPSRHFFFLLFFFFPSWYPTFTFPFTALGNHTPPSSRLKKSQIAFSSWIIWWPISLAIKIIKIEGTGPARLFIL